jgi:hypothetical protein
MGPSYLDLLSSLMYRANHRYGVHLKRQKCDVSRSVRAERR